MEDSVEFFSKDRLSLVISDQKELLRNIIPLKNWVIGRNDRKELAIKAGAPKVLLNLFSSKESSLEEKYEVFIVLNSLMANDKKAFVHFLRPEDLLSVIELVSAKEDVPKNVFIIILKVFTIMLSFDQAAEFVTQVHFSRLFNRLFDLYCLPTQKKYPLFDDIQISSLAASVLDHMVSSRNPQVDSVPSFCNTIFSTIAFTSRLKESVRYRYFKSCDTLIVNSLAILNSYFKVFSLRANLPRSIELEGENDYEELGDLKNLRFSLFGDKMSERIFELFSLAREYHSSIRLLALSCLVTLYKSGILGKDSEEDIKFIVIPILIRLFSQSQETQQIAPRLLAMLVNENEVMQKVAANANVIISAKELLNKVVKHSNDEYPITEVGCLTDALRLPTNTKEQNDLIMESLLLFIAALTTSKDEYRKMVVDANYLPIIIDALSNDSKDIRKAACECILSLTRSVYILRTGLAEADLNEPLMKLLIDSDVRVQSSAMAVVCNLLLKFSPLRNKFLTPGFIDVLVANTAAKDKSLRRKAVWALRNSVYENDEKLKRDIIQKVGHDRVLELCNDEDLGVQEQILQVFRNFACPKGEGVYDFLEVISLPVLLSIIYQKLLTHNPVLIEPGIFTLVHIASSDDEFRDVILEEKNILLLVKDTMLKEAERYRTEHVSDNSSSTGGSEVELQDDEYDLEMRPAFDILEEDTLESSSGILLAGIWLCISLLWSNQGSTPTEQDTQGAKILRELGFEDCLYLLQNHPSPDVRERIKDALSRIHVFN
ncbi:GID complex armadillo repeat subunit Gid5 [Schizosaccharomyces osmophilus]|uniref:GID complex armadillo repeat subunit Gid5 n=1 Tax=Schizosaccharomyces osmophilus TaxID=2545709 RepID=A0AAE9WF65_9SCHI|nr:GID complex armadillo repeat subunit Gid5 [Schizosaccharomyces osmophilus]WBW75179.1 GID complex armadillo repeat subunit Gid5 [Schizosaccharomyces osmophilus]